MTQSSNCIRFPKNYGNVLHLAFNFLLSSLSVGACNTIARKYLIDQGFVVTGDIQFAV